MAEGEGVDLTQKGRSPSAEEVQNFHTNADTDSRREAIHHTLGAGDNQAASGNHDHRGGNSVQLLTGITMTGSRGGNVALLSVIQALVALGATDSTTA
tara:strand:+ start:11567 stop:11860 length:294 start_codon:yes stop_codon:yes gene_type:complete